MIIGDKVKNTYFKLLSVCLCLHILSFIGIDFLWENIHFCYADASDLAQFRDKAMLESK
jgi:hypothetical protein